MAGALSDGTRIGGFELAGVIGRGGFGVTYRATEQRTGAPYAIKEYLPETLALRDPSGLVTSRPGHSDPYERGKEAFMTEANILKDLPRRNGLVRVRGAFEKFGTAYCVMEFIEGDSLDRMANRLIAKAGHVPEALLVDLAISVLWALDALHAGGVIHRDVKPANIMLRRSGEPVVIDFGAARRLNRAGEQQIIFTRGYAALEQFPVEMSGFGRSFEEGPWSDLYSLSVVLYELVAKGLPPTAPERAEAVLAGRPDPYIPLAGRIADTAGAGRYSAAVLAAIDEGCALMPRARPPSARAFAEALRPGAWAVMSTREADRRTEPPDRAGDAEPRAPGGRPAGRVALVLLLLLTAAAGVYVLLAAPQTARF